jgi:hypothetical protein
VAPQAELRHESLWQASLPECVAVVAVGEAFNYAADASASFDALRARLADVHAALQPGGLLLFDIAGPGRSGPDGWRRAFWRGGGDEPKPYLCMEEHERADGAAIERHIDVFVPEGELYRRVHEYHPLRLYRPEAVEAALDELGFSWQRIPGYGDADTAAAIRYGWYPYVAVRGA